MIKLRTAQKIFLDKVNESRKKGNNKGLLIFATGLGKTLASLSDAIRVAGRDGKILVLAHNHNLLHQHAKDFRLLNDKKNIGFLYGYKKDIGAEVLFANIMTIKNKKYLHSFKPDEFDYIIIDETHHAGAKSYRCIFDYFKPKFLLGMTATPIRSDPINIMPMYDDNIILEINTFDAINKCWLRPYKYVFLWDKWCDYSKAKEYRTKFGYYKYDTKELGRSYFVPERDRAIIQKFKKIAMDRRGIGFCISIEESIRMAKLFNDNGISAVAVWGGSGKGRTMSVKERDKILEDFREEKYQVIFNCEIIGEGLHFPSVDVILKLRPTQSVIKDNQHNGRGLYNIDGLESDGSKYKKLLIIDWVGNYNNAYYNYTYQGKPKKRPSNELIDIRNTTELPIGCSVKFEERVIKEFNEQMNSCSRRGLQKSIKRYHEIYKQKPYRGKLYKKNPDIYGIFWKYNLLDKYCLVAQREDLIKVIKRYHEIYKEKPTRTKLKTENHKIYNKFYYLKLLDKYCISIKDFNRIKVIKKYNEIYKEKPRRMKLQTENPNIYSYFLVYKLLDKYCLAPKFPPLDPIKKYHKIYKEKPIRTNFSKENPGIYLYFRKNNLLDKYCLESRNKPININEEIKKYHEIYKEKPNRKKLQTENMRIYYTFKENNLLDKYCISIKDFNRIKVIKKYHEIYKQKPYRGKLSKENPDIYGVFWKYNLLDKYCSNLPLNSE